MNFAIQYSRDFGLSVGGLAPKETWVTPMTSTQDTPHCLYVRSGSGTLDFFPSTLAPVVLEEGQVYDLSAYKGKQTVITANEYLSWIAVHPATVGDVYAHAVLSSGDHIFEASIADTVAVVLQGSALINNKPVTQTNDQGLRTFARLLAGKEAAAVVTGDLLVFQKIVGPVSWTGTRFEVSQEAVLAQKEAQAKIAVQDFLNETAAAHGYGDSVTAPITSVRSYAGFANPFQDEALKIGAWSADCWVKCYELLAAVKAGTIEAPSIEEIISALPALVL